MGQLDRDEERNDKLVWVIVEFAAGDIGASRLFGSGKPIEGYK